MAYLAKTRKCDLITLVQELNLEVPPNPKIAQLRTLIIKSDDYNEEETKCMLDCIIEERLEEREREEREERARHELELKKLEIAAARPTSEFSESGSVFKTNNLLKLMNKYDGEADISSYLTLFERQASRTGVPKDEWISNLLVLLPTDITNWLAREPDPGASDYDHIKRLLLNRFRLSPEQFRQNFVFHKKGQLTSWRDYAFELNNFFQEWINGLGIQNFEDLKQLMVADQIKRKMPNEMRQHFIDELPGINKVNELVTKLDSYETARYASYPQVRNMETRYKQQPSKDAAAHETRPSTSTHHSNTGKRLNCFNCGKTGHKSIDCKNKDVKCFKCNKPGHKSPDCIETSPPKQSVKIVHENPNVAPMSMKPLHGMHKTIKIANVPVTSLIDTGSQATLIRKDIYEKLQIPELDPPRVELSGLGHRIIKPLGSFTSDICIDGFQCTANISVVENKIMTSEAIIGMDILSQGKTTITKNEVIFHKDLPEEESPLQVLTTNIISNETEVNIGCRVPKPQADEILQLVTEYKPAKTKSAKVEMNISVKSNEIIFHRPRRLPFAERDIVDKQVKEWLVNGIIEPCASEYSSQVVVVKKKDGTPRVCIDYRKINKLIIKDRYPLPLIEDVLDRLQSAQVFSTIDLKNGFFHVGVEEKSRPYTSFVTHSGQYQFLRVPFGLCKSPSVFQRYVNTVFRDLITKGWVLPYMDDVIILAKDRDEGIKRLKQVLQTARDYGLELNIKKCQFLHEKIEFLGHVIENGRLYPSPAKTDAVTLYPELKCAKDVQSFLGLTGYFRKFIANYSIIAKPLSDLLKKNRPFQFQKNEKNSFHQLKQLLCAKPVLQIYDQNSETELHTDASIDGYGAVLMQKSTNDNCFHPVYYMSKKTTDAERKFSSYELEVLAIITALRKFRVYLLGINFKIITDCNAFKMTMSKRDICTRIARWALLLEDFNYSIEHRSGTKMSHVDALSRFPVMLITEDSVVLKVKKAQEDDSEIRAIKEVLETKAYDDYCLKGNILYKFLEGAELLVVPDEMQTEVIKQAHERGHFAIKRTAELINQSFYIPKIKSKIEKCIANCVTCILSNRKQGKQEGQLHPLEKEEVPLHTYHIDHIGPLEGTNKNYKHILSIIDSFTKFVWLYPTKSTSSQEVIAKLKLQNSIFGNPIQIITDKGACFTSKEFAEYCNTENIKHHAVTTGLPRANGQVERLNSIVISVLMKLSIEDPSKWFKHVDKVQRVINSTFQRSIGTTPFELLFGTRINQKGDLNVKELLDAEFQSQFVKGREDLRHAAKRQILRIQEENKKSFNQKRRSPRKYQIGDLVAIKRTQFGPGVKLKPLFLGPYKITQVKHNDTYDVQKVGTGEGPHKTSTCAEYIKPWTDL